MTLMFRSFALAALMLLVVPTLIAPVSDAAPTNPVRVAVLDTGINPDHSEFAPGQVVAWKDYVNQRPTPYDDHGHGTATASLVGGLNASTCSASSPKISYAPGVELIIAKVMNSEGSGSTSTIENAIGWAVSQGASVISISIGSTRPLPLHGTAITSARNAGVLVVVSAGNGVENAGLVPYPSWYGSYGNDDKALSVGGGTRTGTLTSTTGNSDPDVTSWSDNVCVARHTGGYRTIGGTSFSAPIVAGMAAKVIEVARANGQRDDPTQIQNVLMFSARNNVFSPYAREGLGYLLDTGFAIAVQHAAAGSTTTQLWADYDAQGPHAAPDRNYRTAVQMFKRAQL